jgi:hypothetical protein
MPAKKPKLLSVAAWKRKQLKNPAIKKEYDALEEEFASLRKRIEADLKDKRAKRAGRPKARSTYKNPSR